jgi:hypothetical protein
MLALGAPGDVVDKHYLKRLYIRGLWIGKIVHSKDWERLKNGYYSHNKKKVRLYLDALQIVGCGETIKPIPELCNG